MRRPALALMLLLVVGSSCKKAPAPARPTLPWIEDDYPRALAEARQKGKPLFVDAWAPWCHTCRSMKSFVFTDAALQPLADRFVWLALNTEKPENAKVLARLPVTVWPTLYVVDPATEKPEGRWLGSASVPQLQAFLTDGERAVAQARAGGLKAGDPLAYLVAADHETAAGRHAQAAPLYGEAVAAGAADWPRRPDALVAWIDALRRAEDPGPCVNLGIARLGDTGDSARVTDFAIFAMGCADKLPATDERKVQLQKAVEARLAALVGKPEAPLSVDDRGDAYRVLWEVREQLGDAEGAKKAAEDALIWLEEAAHKAPDALAASTFDAARASAYLTLGRGDDAIAMLQEREKALPQDYTPPHQLARVYQKLGRHDEALAAADRALAKAYGPRKDKIATLRAEIAAAKGAP